MTIENEPDYLQALCRGERAQIAHIYRTYAQQVQGWVLQNNGDVADAQDLFQESLIAIYDRYCGTDFQLTSSFGALLFSICKKQWYNRLRKKKRRESVRNAVAEQYNDESEDPDLLVLAEEALTSKRREECMQETFEQLSEQCREVLSRLAKGHSGNDIAEALDLPSANAVYQAKHRCADRWRRLFEQTFTPD
jgi:RNA polymerase sigma factor (sigma-70 family)